MNEPTNEATFDFLELTARTLKVVQVIAIGFTLAQLILITAYA
jgi:hypothetical protein